MAAELVQGWGPIGGPVFGSPDFEVQDDAGAFVDGPWAKGLSEEQRARVREERDTTVFVPTWRGGWTPYANASILDRLIPRWGALALVVAVVLVLLALVKR